MIPEIYKNFNEEENLAREIKRLQKAAKKPTQISAKIFFDRLVLIFGGRFIKYAKLIDNPEKKPPGAKIWNDYIFKVEDGEKFVKLNAYLC